MTKQKWSSLINCYIYTCLCFLRYFECNGVLDINVSFFCVKSLYLFYLKAQTIFFKNIFIFFLNQEKKSWTLAFELSAHAQCQQRGGSAMAADGALLLSLVEEFVSGLQDSKAKDAAKGTAVVSGVCPHIYQRVCVENWAGAVSFP